MLGYVCTHAEQDLFARSKLPQLCGGHIELLAHVRSRPTGHGRARCCRAARVLRKRYGVLLAAADKLTAGILHRFHAQWAVEEFAVVKISVERIRALYMYAKKGDEGEHYLLAKGRNRQADFSAVVVIDGEQRRTSTARNCNDVRPGRCAPLPPPLAPFAPPLLALLPLCAPRDPPAPPAANLSETRSNTPPRRAVVCHFVIPSIGGCRLGGVGKP